MNKVRFSLRRGFSLALAAVAISVLGNLSPAVAATYFWDGDGAGTQDGGAGVWNTTNTRWSAVDEGTTFIAWPNLAADTAVFDDTAGAVTIGGALNVGIIRTTVGGYSIGNGNGVGGAANTINSPTYDATHTSGTTTITALNAGTVTKTGAGRVEINNTANPSATKWVLKGGALTAPAPSRFGTNPGALVTDFFTFDGGGFGGNTTTAYTFGTNQGVKITANGANFGATGNTVIMNITGPIDAKGDITITGGGVFTGSAHNAGGILQLSNGSNAWTGAAGGGTINISGTSGSGLRLGASNVIPNEYTVNLTVAGTFMDMATNTANETVKAIKGSAGTVQVGAQTLTIADGNDAGGLSSTYSSVFSSTATTAKIVKNGSGTQIFSGSSTGWTGEMELNAGKLGVGGNNSLGSGVGAQLTLKGGTLANTNATGRTISTNLAVNISGDFTVDDSIAQLTPVDAGVITFGGTNTIRGGNRAITVSATGGNLSLLTFSSAVGEDAAGRGLEKKGNATLALNATNTYSGDTIITAGTINVDGDGTLGNGAGTLKMNGGRLNATASRTVATLNPINVTANSDVTSTSNAAGGANFEFSTGSVTGNGTSTLTFRNDGGAGVGPFKPRFSGDGINFTNPIALAAGANGVTQLEFFNTGADQTFSGNISGTGSINKSASVNHTGTKTILGGTNSYTGTTTINDGVLQLDGTHTGGGAYNVNDGTLQGNGATTSAVIVADGSTLSPGASVGSLGTGALTFNATGTAGATLKFEIGPQVLLEYTADLVNAPGGSLTIADPSTTFGSTLLLASAGFPGAVPDGTKYTVISYNGTWNGKPFKGAPDMGVVMLGTQQFRIRYADINPGGNFPTETASNIGVGKFVTLTAVPELGSFITMGLMGCCAFGAVRLGRRYGFKALSL